MHISVGISLSSPIFPSSFVTISELFYSEVFGTFEIISAVLLLIKSPVYSVAFWTDLFYAVLNAFAADFLV